MPNPFDLLKAFKPAALPPLSVEEQAQQDAQAELSQSHDPAWKQYARSAVNAGVGIVKGLTGLGEQGPSGPTWTNAGQVAAAAVPFAGLKGLYSRAERIAEQLPEAIRPAAALSKFQNLGSPEENEWRGITEFLKAQPPMAKVAKSDIQHELAAHPIGLQVTNPDHPKFKHYTLPGGGNYQETLIQLTPKEPDPQDFTTWYNHRYGTNHSTQDLIDQQVITNPNDQRQYRRAHGDPQFTSGHFDEPNVLVHVRSNERQLAEPKTTPLEIRQKPTQENFWGDAAEPSRYPWQLAVEGEPQHMQSFKTLEEAQQELQRMGGAFKEPVRGRFLEEIQSDWHQKGKEFGYRTPESSHQLVDAERAKEVAEQAFQDFLHQMAAEMHAPTEEPQLYGYNPDREQSSAAIWKHIQQHLMASNTTTPEGMAWWQKSQEYHQLERAWQEAADQADKVRSHMLYQPPNAPFKESWPDLALKQQVLDVADHPDLSWLGFTTGDTQADRYNLSKHVSDLRYDANTHHLTALDHHGEEVFDLFIPPERLPDYIGKDATRKLMASPGHGDYNPEDFTATTGEPFQPVYRLTGESLNIGGEGMRSFYDQVLPSRLNKLLKPFGGQVELGSIPGETTVTTPAWIAQLPPEMKAAILKKGLPLLSLLGLYQPPQSPDASLTNR